MSDRLRYGVIGCGRVFEQFHLGCVTARDDFRIVAACDTDPTRAARTLRESAPRALVTDDVETFLSRGRPDVVAVCTPNDAHSEPVAAALASGAAVLCEKPLATSLAEARRLAGLVGDGVLGVNLPYRFHELAPVFVEALGDDAHDIEVGFATAGRRLWRPATAWYDDPRRAGGGALLDLGPHVLDLLTAMFGPATPEACQLDDPVLEERVELWLRFGRGPVAVSLNRAGRRVAFTVTARRRDGHTVTLDLRRGTVTWPDRQVAATRPRPELAAIDKFLAAAAGEPGGAMVPATEAVGLQETITALYDSATALKD